MKKLIFSIFGLVLIVSSVYAQERSVSVIVGVNPALGGLNTSIGYDDEDDNIDYKSTFGVIVDI